MTDSVDVKGLFVGFDDLLGKIPIEEMYCWTLNNIMGEIFRTRISGVTLLITAVIVTTVFSCVHEPFPSPGGGPDPGNGEPVDTDTVNFNMSH
ncbi:MAG: hypothetical protein U5K79_15855 [Cyclobacteriaceae bacterium]|nr:hypothetical protein [Cyclobacteriaceae bacterium]